MLKCLGHKSKTGPKIEISLHHFLCLGYVHDSPRDEDRSSKRVGKVEFSNFGPFWAISPKRDLKSKFHSIIFCALGRSMIP